MSVKQVAGRILSLTSIIRKPAFLTVSTKYIRVSGFRIADATYATGYSCTLSSKALVRAGWSSERRDANNLTRWGMYSGS